MIKLQQVVNMYYKKIAQATNRENGQGIATIQSHKRKLQ